MGAPASTGPAAGEPGLDPTPFGWIDVAVVGGLAFAGFAMRLYQWIHTPVMFNDGPRFLVQAQQFAAGAWEAALHDPYHPLYAMATAGARLVAGMQDIGPSEWERAAVAVSIAAGTASIPVFYAFLKSAFDARTAWIGAAILAVNPYSVEFSADVQSEGLYQFVFLLAVALGWMAVKRGRSGLAGWAGVAAGLAYLTRPEGLGVAVGVGLVGALQLVLRRWDLGRSLAWGGALLAGVMLTIAPYLVWLRADNGIWTLSQKKSVAALAGTVRDIQARPALGKAPGAEVQFSPEVASIRYEWRHKEAVEREQEGIPEPVEGQPMLKAVGKLLLTTQSALRPEVVLFAVIGLLVARGRPGLRGQFMIGVLVVYALAMWGLATNYGYLSRRHVLAPATLLIGYAALAVPVAGGYLARGLARLGGRRGGHPSPALAVGLALTLVLGVALGKLLRPHRSHNRVERVAAEWIHEHPEPDIPGGPVASGKRRVAYYAGAPWFPLRKIPEEAPLATALRLAGVHYVVADQDDVETWKDLSEPERVGLRVVYSTRAGGETATVFEVVSRASSRASSREGG
jgi:4-amino-4-deoxy-L-arabinose transferase-like glycosyltransferase